MTIYSDEALIDELRQFTRSLSQAEFEVLAQWLDAKASVIYATGYQDGLNEPATDSSSGTDESQ